MSRERPQLEAHLRQLADPVSRLAQEVPIGGAERIEVSVVEKPDGPQNLRRLAIEHLLESA
jgi:hypothetical protein